MELFEAFGARSGRRLRARRGSARRESYEADLFFAELTGTALPQPRTRRPAQAWSELTEDAAGPPKVVAPACTCTHTSRKYANGKVTTADLIGAKATIKARYGKVCCEGTTTTSTAYKVAWAGVTKPEGTMVWAQTGFGRERNSGSATIKNYRYWEVNGSSYNVFYDVTNPPAEGSAHTYQCEVDNSTGKWTFVFDGKSWATHTDAGWKAITGSRADYTGEIFNEDDDMPGTAADKCTFRDCKKKSTGGAYVDAGLTTANVGSSDSTQWGASRISSTGMDIWDKNPLP